MRTKKDINAIKNLFLENFKNAGSELKFRNLYELLVCVMLSAQCTDKRVNLIKMAKSVMSEFDGEIPTTEKELMSLAGVGQKTAHVVLIEHFGSNLMAVDTHVFRVAHRLGLSRSKTPEAVELDLTKAFKTELNTLHQAMVLFGRYTCKAVKPNCKECFLNELCSSKDKNFP